MSGGSHATSRSRNLSSGTRGPRSDSNNYFGTEVRVVQSSSRQSLVLGSSGTTLLVSGTPVTRRSGTKRVLVLSSTGNFRVQSGYSVPRR